VSVDRVVERRVSTKDGGDERDDGKERLENREMEREQGRCADLKGSRRELKYVSAKCRRLLCVAKARIGRRRIMGRSCGFLGFRGSGISCRFLRLT